MGSGEAQTGSKAEEKRAKKEGRGGLEFQDRGGILDRTGGIQRTAGMAGWALAGGAFVALSGGRFLGDAGGSDWRPAGRHSGDSRACVDRENELRQKRKGGKFCRAEA